MSTTDTLTETETVRAALAAEGVDTDADRYRTGMDFHIRKAHSLVERELAPHTTADLSLTETLLAAAMAADASGSDKNTAAISSAQQGSRQISFDTDDLEGTSASLWTQAIREDPTNRLRDIDKPTASISVPDVRGGR